MRLRRRPREQPNGVVAEEPKTEDFAALDVPEQDLSLPLEGVPPSRWPAAADVAPAKTPEERAQGPGRRWRRRGRGTDELPAAENRAPQDAPPLAPTFLETDERPAPRGRRRLPKRRRRHREPQLAPAAEPAPEHARETTTAVAGRDLVKRFGQGARAVEALRGISVAFERETFSAIMGASGSGKSTLMHVLAGLDRPDEGNVELGGASLDGLTDAALTRLRRERVGFVFQSFNLLAVLSAEENIVLPLRLAGKPRDPLWIDELVNAFGLAERREHRPAQLSGGEQQRVAIARALVMRPAVVFADEPTGNLDSVTSEEVLGLLRQAVDAFAQTVVMVTHDPLAAAHADRVVFLADGRLVSEESAPTPQRILDALRRP